MRDHEYDVDGSAPRERPANRDQEASGVAASAAVAGRIDAIGGDGMAGLQRAAGNAALTSAIQRSTVSDVISQPGRGLPGDVRGPLERGFGRSLEHVRLHDDAEALRSARDVSAYAYASGDHIVVPPGAPLETYAEETEHTFQQRGGPVAGSPDGRGHLVSDPSDSFETAAKAKAEQVVAAASTPTQRRKDEDPYPSQRAETESVVQRQEAESEEEETPVEEEG